MSAIFKKEFRQYFKTPIGYIFIAIYILIFNIFFLNTSMNALKQGETPYFQYIFYTLATTVTFIIPILTMRIFAEEKKQGTDQLLFTSPISVAQIVVGKFFACFSVFIVANIISLMYVLILSFFGTVNLKIIAGTYLGYLLLGGSYIAIGMLASSFTENQIVAGVTTIAIFLTLWFVKIFQIISPRERFDLFPRGAVNLENIIYFVIFIGTILLLNILFVQRKRWSK